MSNGNEGCRAIYNRGYIIQVEYQNHRDSPSLFFYLNLNTKDMRERASVVFSCHLRECLDFWMDGWLSSSGERDVSYIFEMNR